MGKVPELVVVLLCILGGGALVTAFAAFGKSIFGKDEPRETNFNQRSAEQDSYLRRVREINQASIWGTSRAQRKEERRQREREASDIEIQSGYSHAGMHRGYSQQEGVYQGQNYGHGQPQAYYEEDQQYAGHDNGYHGYEEQPQHQQQQQQPQHQHQQYQQQKPYLSGHSNVYANQSKSGPTETWNEVQR